MSIKVSVIVPVFNGGADLGPLVNSLREQSMPADEFEAIFVDDGSTDGTGLLLDGIAAEESNVQVIHIPNSGWPGRPRNVGMDAARGEFFQFVDSDDHLGPEALERLYAMATANDSDVVVGKVVSNFRGIAQVLFRVDRPRCSVYDAPLVSNMTPHKFFRAAFLRREGIRFPEGRRRLEDQAFVLPAYLAAGNVSVLASYPCYYYLKRTDASNAGSVQIVPKGYYGNVREVLDILVASVPAGAARWPLMRRWYRNEILSRLSEPVTLDQPPEFRHELFDVVRAVECDYMTPEVVEGLGALMRVRAALLQAGREADLLALARRLNAIAGRAAVERIAWRDGLVHVQLSADLADEAGPGPFVIVERGGRTFIDPSLLEGFATEPVDAGGSVSDLHVSVQVRDPATSIEWPTKVRQSVALVPVAEGPDGRRVSPRVRVTVSIDPLTAAGGSRLPAGSWELLVRVNGFGIERTALATMSPDRRVDARPALLGSPPVAVVAGFDDERRFELDIDRRRRTLASAVAPRKIRVISDGRTVGVLPGVAASDDGPVPVHAVLSVSGRELELPAVAIRAWGRVEVRIDAAGVLPSGEPGALGIALDGPGQALIDLGPVTPGRGRITVANTRSEPWRDRAGPAVRRRVRRAYRALPEPAKQVARRARRVAGTIKRRLLGRPRRSR